MVVQVTPIPNIDLGDPGILQEGGTMTVYFSVNSSDPRLYIDPGNITYMNWAFGDRPYLSMHIQRGGPIEVGCCEISNIP